MRDWQGRKYWLIGASEGLGRALAQQMSRMGAQVIVSARTEDRLQDLVAELPGQARAVACDVTQDASVAAAAAEVGEIDGMIYLAGVYWPMRAQEWNGEQAVAMAEVNFTGAVRAVGAVLPAMVARGRGHVVLTGSLAGFRGLPGSIGYGASKAGVMNLAESLYADLRGSGVDVQVVNPGFIRTRLTDKNDFTMPGIMEPEAAARIYFEALNDDSFKRSFPLGFSTLFRAGQFLPDWIWYRLFRRGP